MIYEFYSGSYGEKGQEGIVKFRLDPVRETLEKIYAYDGICHPSYLELSRDQSLLYAVSEETPEGGIHVLSVGEEGLTRLNSGSTKGADPCHISLSGDERLLFASNYSSGSMAAFRLDEDGISMNLSQLVIHEGKGGHKTRQASPHIHWAKERDGSVFAADLGLDQVFIYKISGESGRLLDTGKRLRLPAGFGPRHLEFHPFREDILYSICELSNEAAVFQKIGEEYQLRQTVSVLPDGFCKESTAAAVKMEKNLLFASSRGSDSVAVFRVLEGGLLERTQVESSGGKTPRDLAVLGDHLVVANQDSDRISVFRIDWDSGRIFPTAMEAAAMRPSCICRCMR